MPPFSIVSFTLRWLPASLLLALNCASAESADTDPSGSRGQAEHVVLVVWDGMRPDFATEQYAPNLDALARSGVRFRRHHSIYPSLTSVNATALATGVYPSRSGMLGNWTYRPDLQLEKPARMDAPETIRKGDELSGGKYLGAPTIAELVQGRGGHTAITGTKTASLLHDRKPAGARKGDPGSVTLFSGETLPPTALSAMVKLLGIFPSEDEVPNNAQDAWTTRALTEVLWREGVPEFSLLWLSDPDRSQHATAPGSEASLGGIKSVDEDLGLVLRALETKGVREKTDVLVASDHGFSTITRSVDVVGLLREKGFAVAPEKRNTLERGEVKLVGNGGTNFYYVGEHDGETIARLVTELQQSNFAGVIFSRAEVAGAFSLARAHLDLPAGPDVVMSFRWSEQKNVNGVPGMIEINGTTDPNKATHGTLSPFDLHNTFIAAGPDFERGRESDLPTSNVDVAATIMHVLGLVPPQPLDGRVVFEAMLPARPALAPAEEKTVEATRTLSSGKWRQYLRTSTVGASVYFDEGSGRFEPK